MSEIDKLKKRVEELEAEVARLKALPQHVTHSHYHYGAPAYAPQPCYPTWTYPQIWYGGQGTSYGGSSG